MEPAAARARVRARKREPGKTNARRRRGNVRGSRRFGRASYCKKKGFPRRDVFESASRESDERASSYHTLYSLDYLKAARGRLRCF
jgi:hypothetical protein